MSTLGFEVPTESRSMDLKTSWQLVPFSIFQHCGESLTQNFASIELERTGVSTFLRNLTFSPLSRFHFLLIGGKASVWTLPEA